MKGFDELLDEVLREDGQAMPRPGLETRVMARLRADERPAAGWLKARWLTAGAMAAAACVVAAVLWVAPRNGSAPQVQRPVVVTKPEANRPHLSTPQAKLAGTHSSDDKTVARRGHPIGTLSKMRRSPVVAQQSRLPKLETFPAVTQKGEAAGWLGGSDAKLATVVREMSPQTLKALQELQESQSRPLTIAAIEIKPLQ